MKLLNPFILPDHEWWRTSSGRLRGLSPTAVPCQTLCVRYYHPEPPTETQPLRPLALLYDQFGRFLLYQMPSYSTLPFTQGELNTQPRRSPIDYLERNTLSPPPQNMLANIKPRIDGTFDIDYNNTRFGESLAAVDGGAHALEAAN
ncbi:hypothetical protein I7I51_03046 [Histoplasma capsulatum]|uniref:Uncharacterized protein n=1 Tax=Ajellomyces capsulatus TaxID=5037 RepID=A0A8A1MPZ5_AJECA|nr:hypothetical protein I7I51_03046 [Histoplasma capsulatum]